MKNPFNALFSNIQDSNENSLPENIVDTNNENLQSEQELTDADDLMIDSTVLSYSARIMHLK